MNDYIKKLERENREKYRYECDRCHRETDIYEARKHTFANNPAKKASVRILCHTCYIPMIKGYDTTLSPEIEIDKSPMVEKHERDWEEFRLKSDEELKKQFQKELEELRKK